MQATENTSTFKEYTDEELETKLDSLMNEEDNWLDDCFAGCGDIPHTKESLLAEEKSISIEKEEEIEAARYKKCGKCGGTGNLSHYHYVAGGECFDCDGKGKIYI